MSEETKVVETTENGTTATEQEASNTTVIPTDATNLFNVDEWSDTIDQPIVEQKEEKVEATTTTTKTEDDDIVDGNEYLKKELGFDDWESAKQQIAELRKLQTQAKTPEERKFVNELSKNLYEKLTSGKEEDIEVAENYILERRLLKGAQKLDVTKVAEASALIKLNLQFKHKELDQDEINDIYQESYNIPTKPKQDAGIDDDDYAEEVRVWDEKRIAIEKKIIRDAKMAKPEILKYESSIVFPKTEVADSQPAGPTQEDLDALNKVREPFLPSIDAALQSFKGFTTEFKDEVVTIPVEYSVTDDEKVKLKSQMEDFATKHGFDLNTFLGPRWLNPDGSINVSKFEEDLYVLDNYKKMMSKAANDAGSKRIAHQIKLSSNIKLNSGGRGTFQPTENKEQYQKEVDTIWEA